MAPKNKHRGPVTMGDVAKKAGVAVSSVSRALSGHPDVSDALRKRVSDVAHKSGYRPNLIASSMRSGSTFTIGFLVRDISNPLFAWIAKGADDSLREHGYSLLLTNSDGNTEVEFAHIDLMRQRRADGIIASLVSENDSDVVNSLRDFAGPIVVLDREVAGLSASFIQIDHRIGVRDAVRHLLQLGHRRVILITGPVSVRSTRERILGFKDAYKEIGLSFDKNALFTGSWSAEFAQAQVSKAFSKNKPPTAVVTGGIGSAEGALQGLLSLGRRVGKDVAFISCDDIPSFSYLNPTISVVSRDYYEYGKSAAEALLRSFGGEANEVKILPTTYIARASSIPCLEPS